MTTGDTLDRAVNELDSRRRAEVNVNLNFLENATNFRIRSYDCRYVFMADCEISIALREARTTAERMMRMDWDSGDAVVGLA